MNEILTQSENKTGLAGLPIAVDTALLVLMFSMSLWYTRFLSPVATTIENSLHIDILFVLLAFTAYLMTDFFARRAEVKNRIKTGLLLVLVLFTVVMPQASQIYGRQITKPSRYVMDAAVQTEEAIKLVLHGQNPYANTYYNTPMAQISSEPAGALEHYVYLPMTFELPTPFYVVFHGLFGWFDLRLFHLLFLFLLIFVLLKLAPNPVAGRALVIVFALNPDVLYYFTQGSNDIVAIACLVTALFLTTKNRYVWAGVFFGVGLLTKQFLILVLPFYLLYLYGRGEGLVRDKQGRLTPLAQVCLVLAAMIAVFGLPYVAWNPARFYDDVIRYPNGVASHGIKITGWGISMLALKIGLLKDQWSYFPAFILYLVFLVPLTGVMLWRQLRQNTMPVMLLGAAIATWVFILLSRFSHNNYFSYAMALFFLAYLGFSGRKESQAGQELAPGAGPV
jgi:hypothetical protein